MRKDTFLFNIFFLAETLGRPMGEIISMTVSEYNYWMAYFKVKKKLQG